MSNKKFSGKLSAKGYYIALILCAVAIGISGYLFYRNNREQNTLQNNPSESLNAPDDNVEVIATQPEEQSTENQSGTNTTPTMPKPGKVVSPVSGAPVADYAMDVLSYNQTTRDWRTHNGIDFAAETGAQVCAAADGIVESVTNDEAMGTTVVISHAEGYTTTYSSLAEEVSVVTGQSVEAGQAIGTVGCTALLETALGEHVHFSVSCDGKPVDPSDFLELGSL